MKQIIDYETGELIDEEETNEIVERKLFELGVVNDEVIEMIEMFKYYEQQYEIFKYKLLKAMKENNIKSWKNDSFSASRKEESIQKRIDIDKLKADGLYEKYLKAVVVKESLQIRFNKRGE